jgi:hypothetical protein
LCNSPYWLLSSSLVPNSFLRTMFFSAITAWSSFKLRGQMSVNSCHIAESFWGANIRSIVKKFLTFFFGRSPKFHYHILTLCFYKTPLMLFTHLLIRLQFQTQLWSQNKEAKIMPPSAILLEYPLFPYVSFCSLNLVRPINDL